MDEFTLLALSLSALLLLLTAYVQSAKPKPKPKPPPPHPGDAAAPPSPRGLPLIGHLHLVTDMPHHAFSELALKLGPIFRLQLGRVPTVVISSASLARHALKTHDHALCSRPQLVSAQYLSFGCSDVTFSRYGPYWRQARKVCVSELLSPRRVASFDLVRDQEAARLVAQLTALAKEDGAVVVNMSDMVFKLANDVLCRVAFGRRFIRSGEKGRLVEVLKETQELFAGFCVGDYYPEWGWVNWVSGYKRRLENNLEDLRAVCDEIIKEHLGRGGGGEDFVDVLLRVQKSEALEVPITDDNLKALVLVLSLSL